MTPEEQLIQRYFDAFNRHDIEGVMACYDEEPVIGGNHPLLKMPNVLCTPHLGWAEWDTFELYFRECFEQIVNYAEGKPLRLAG